ncbi:DUF2778 domain-containing protein [Roseiarcaceae bacterium H3SJ34-1]|uniref:DUF2778 domain-containing protein n=1 Tax=Terripilifer ovatus TaxID=3032367 RepID=UPI003AB91A9D|nr:DUF2778 domain-containing protein [Roseiarcaceae bacterium H3SJ34-1]
MKDKSLPSGGLAPQFRRRRHGYVPAIATCAAILGVAHISGFWDNGDRPPETARGSLNASASMQTAAGKTSTKATVVAVADLKRMLAPSLSSRPEELKLRQDITQDVAQNVAMEAGFRVANLELAAAVPSEPVQPQAARAVPLPPVQMAQILPDAPLPAPRPSDLKFSDPARTANKQVPLQPVPSPVTRVARSTAVPAPAATADNRSFFEKFFNVQQTPAAALAYASPNDGMDLAPSRRLAPAPDQNVAALTAIYDISAGVVHMPNGEKLEAHSGLGDKFDDTSAVHIRMRGPTPPGTYELKEREALFHGVRALRMNPIGGSGTIYGRSGILAHTYMLGPRGDSNGCVSFKNYDRFLQAYLRGEVKRLVVVARRGDPVPSVATMGRSARNGSGA